MPSAQKFPTLLEPKQTSRSQTPRIWLPRLRSNDPKDAMQSRDESLTPPRSLPGNQCPSSQHPNMRGECPVGIEFSSSRARSDTNNIDSPAMHRKLSFVRCSMAQIRIRVLAGSVSWTFPSNFATTFEGLR
eukprot:TRINITY_DN27430_c0_g1_i1.p2 TRINITY_DN27430_c0_g1~~TRINITY_DN27430_c0_g1_i1.p2  ORF type:complete len:131 (-),score=5.63 TRINITY_DN27430_c0_g1_i1:202-594(-)